MRFSITFTIELTRGPSTKLTRTSWRRRRASIKDRDGATCRYCGELAPKGAVDHVVPLSKGGTDDLDNLVWACTSCNSAKGDKTIEEWEGPAGRLKVTRTPSGELRNPRRFAIRGRHNERIRELADQGQSIEEIAQGVFGSTEYRRIQEVKEAIDDFVLV